MTTKNGIEIQKNTMTERIVLNLPFPCSFTYQEAEDLCSYFEAPRCGVWNTSKPPYPFKFKASLELDGDVTLEAWREDDKRGGWVTVKKKELKELSDKIRMFLFVPQSKTYYLAVSKYGKELSGVATIENRSLQVVETWQTDSLHHLSFLVKEWMSSLGTTVPKILHNGGIAHALADMLRTLVDFHLPNGPRLYQAERTDASICTTVEMILDAEMKDSKRIPITYDGRPL